MERVVSDKHIEKEPDSSLLLLNEFQVEYPGEMNSSLLKKIRAVRNCMQGLNEVLDREQAMEAELRVNNESLIGVTFGEGEHIVPTEDVYWEKREEDEV